MRSSILTRSVVAVATIAIGSVALGAVPASASAGAVSRATVLSVTKDVRAALAAESEYSYTTEVAINKLAAKACGIDFDGYNRVSSQRATPVTPGSADGVLISILAREYDTQGDVSYRLCTFAALAATDSSFVLSGDATVAVTDDVIEAGVSAQATASASTKLAGDAIVTNAVSRPIVNYGTVQATGTLTASGNTVKTTTTKVKVADKKSKAEKKAAKKKYAQRLASAKKSYDKALDKAGSSKSKKAAAKKSYSAKKASAKAKYKYAIASYKLVDKTTVVKKPFTLGATVPVTFYD